MSNYTQNRWQRKPKPESKPSFITTYYYAYLNGEFKGEVKLTVESKKRYEDKGYTFKRRHK